VEGKKREKKKQGAKDEGETRKGRRGRVGGRKGKRVVDYEEDNGSYLSIGELIYKNPAGKEKKYQKKVLGWVDKREKRSLREGSHRKFSSYKNVRRGGVGDPFHF